MTQNAKRLLWLLYFLVFLTMLVMSLLTPMVSDDFGYSFSYADWTRIEHLSQIPGSMAAHRERMNGRVLLHALVQVLLMLPRPVYCVLNALLAVFSCMLICRLLCADEPKSFIPVLLFGLFSVCCFTPAFGENYLWLDGSLNYFWTMFFSLLFLQPFFLDYLEGASPKEALPVRILRFPLAFYFGACSESSSLVFLLLGIFLYLFSLIRSRKFDLQKFLWLLAATLGYVFLMTAPASASRGVSFDLSNLGYNIRYVFSYAEKDLLVPWLIFAALLALALSHGVDRRLCFFASFLFLAGLASLFSYLFASYFVPRHMCCVVLLTTLASSVLLTGLCRIGKPVFARLALSGLAVLFLLRFPVGMLDIAVSHHKQTLREEQIRQSLEAGETTVYLENFYPNTSFTIPYELNLTRPDYGPNVNIADYYGLEAVYGVDPEEPLQ